MNKLCVIILSAALLHPVILSAQDTGQYWHRGDVHLLNGEHLQGMVQPNFEDNYLVVNTSQGIKTYNARQVHSFEILDPVSRAYRSYYSLPHPTKLKPTYLFYELLQEGELTLFNRESKRVDERFQRTWHPSGLIYHPQFYEVTVDEFYVMDKKGRLCRFYGSRKELLQIMQEQAEKIEMFMNTKKLRSGNKDHLKVLFRYYHLLQLNKQRKYLSVQEHAYYLPAE